MRYDRILERILPRVSPKRSSMLNFLLGGDTKRLRSQQMKAEEISRVVKERYSKAAQTSGAGEDSYCCPGVAPPGAGFAAQHHLYTPEDLASAPQLAVKLSRGCGNPVSFADLRAGEVVVDLGCGAGLDVIFAARRIAPGRESRRRGFRTANDRARDASAYRSRPDGFGTVRGRRFGGVIFAG